MIKLLPFYIWIIVWALAFVAGIINVVGFMSFDHQAVTHLTGVTSLLSTEIVNPNLPIILHLLGVIASFVFGSTLSGAIILDKGRNYDIVLFLESLLLFIAVPLLNKQIIFGVYLAGCACGLQNAMATTYSGAVIRTSHLTGMFTDLGIFIGHFFRGLKIEKVRLKLCLIVISGFFVGGIFGAFTYQELGHATLYIAASITFIIASLYMIYSRT